ncbi:hypothetical protein D9758_009084 [Tetrapyrgos nigripes]|uniref:Uncharacterized protein n=1 Tax=Tetrapyrgos nigripes TaxID=182062 RepID=A0A8H5LKY8_9AGAR|nr:hypothetical protein D9758_009084 [Tetrapyrgos nigripes]
MSAPRNDISADTAAALSLALEWGLYGLSVYMFGSTMRSLLRTPPVNVKMVAITLVFFTLSTSHAIIDIVRLNQGFVNERNSFPGGPNAFFGDATQIFFLIRSSLYVAQTLVADGVVIYRCYSVWQSYYVIIFPSILWCSVLASGAGALNSLAEAGRANGAAEIFTFAKWINSFFGSSLATNIISTTLLAYRIWAVNKQTSQFRKDDRGPLATVVRVVLDAGILYSVTLIIALITFLTHSNSQFILLDVLMPVMPIAFYMIILRLSHARKQLTKSSGGSSGGAFGSQAHNQGSYPLRPVRIQIATQQETDGPGKQGSSESRHIDDFELLEVSKAQNVV